MQLDIQFNLHSRKFGRSSIAQRIFQRSVWKNAAKRKPVVRIARETAKWTSRMFLSFDLTTQEIDLHFRGESFRDYPEEQVAFSNVINTRPLLMTHELQVRRYPNEIGNWFTIVAPQLWAVYAVLLALCACLMNKLSSHQICRNSVWTLIQMSLNISVSINSCLHFPLLLFYLPLMFAVWHFNLILFGQLNTNMVSFDRRDVIVKLEDALKIQRIPCWGIGKTCIYSLNSFQDAEFSLCVPLHHHHPASVQQKDLIRSTLLQPSPALCRIWFGIVIWIFDFRTDAFSNSIVRPAHFWLWIVNDSLVLVKTFC